MLSIFGTYILSIYFCQHQVVDCRSVPEEKESSISLLLLQAECICGSRAKTKDANFKDQPVSSYGMKQERLLWKYSCSPLKKKWENAHTHIKHEINLCSKYTKKDLK